MRILLAAYDMGRKPKYRLLTRVYEDNGVLYTEKIAKEESAKPFLSRVEEGYRLMAKTYGQEHVVPLLKAYDDRVVLSYGLGESIQSLLLRALNHHDEEEAKRLLGLYRDFVLSAEKRPFEVSPEFIEWFGESTYEGDALSVSNIDATFSNVLVCDGECMLIDCEWAMDFPVPTDYILYRTVSGFLNKQPKVAAMLGNDYLYDFYGINETLRAEFAKYDDHFIHKVVAVQEPKPFNASYVLSENESLREETSSKQAHIVKLEQDVLGLESNVRCLEAEIELKKHHIEVLQSEKSDLEDFRDHLQKEVAQVNAEKRCIEDAREKMEQEKTTMERNLKTTTEELERAQLELKQSVLMLEGVKSELEKTKEELSDARSDLTRIHTDLDRAQLQLEETAQEKQRVDHELEDIHNSTVWRMANRYYRIRDWFLPPHSRRKLFIKVMLYGIRHPIICFRALKRGKGPEFFRALKHNPDMASAKIDNYAKKMENIGSNLDLTLIKSTTFEPFSLPSCKRPIVSIIVPVYNQFEYTYNCLLAILKHTDMAKTPYEVIVGDDVSTDETVRLGEIVKNVTIIRNKKNTGFLLNCNNAARKAKGKYVYFLNNDTNVQPNYLSELVEYMEAHPDCGAAGSKLVYANGMLQEAGGIFWKDGSAWNYGNKQNPNDPAFNYVKDVDYISGASLMIRSDVWKKLGGFDEEFAPAYCEDSDICFSIRYKLGMRVVYVPTSVVVHFEGISNGTDVHTTTGLKRYQLINQEKFVKKWGEPLSRHEENGVNVFTSRDMSKNKKCLLFIDHYVPHYDKDAGSRTTFAYLKLMAEMGYNVKFIGDNYYRHEPYTTTLQKLGIEVLYGEKMFNNWKDYLLSNEKYFDYIYLTRPHISIKYIDFIRKNMHGKVVYYGQDLCMLRLNREYEITHNDAILPEIRKFKELEETIMSKVDESLYPSMVEVDYVKEHYPDFPVGYQQAFVFDEKPYVEPGKKRKGLLFVGGFGHSPNVDACIWFVNEIFPLVRQKLPDAVFTIIGSNPTDEICALNGNGVIVRGGVSDDELSEAYGKTALVIAPLRYGAGIKGKIVEAMANCLPIVTTSIGAEGIVEADKAMMIADDAKGFADAIVELYTNHSKQVAITKQGRRIVDEYYSVASAKKWILEEFPQ